MRAAGSPDGGGRSIDLKPPKRSSVSFANHKVPGSMRPRANRLGVFSPCQISSFAPYLEEHVSSLRPALDQRDKGLCTLVVIDDASIHRITFTKNDSFDSNGRFFIGRHETLMHTVSLARHRRRHAVGSKSPTGVGPASLMYSITHKTLPL
ncbi:hypothetical protein EVAR_78593_1 [Eumeta japonica]|uniref:Uncharacterized protein n=1 Tax=Eumeta variegata TaxID=151549 RepID=A0A4C1U8I0_EUMVA|nr:hypothetical protein EVAR_78593_1 [Eumeta japonica]